MGPYIDFFCGFGLRLKELRIGHDKMPVTRADGVTTEFPVRKYGLTGAHHVLLEYYIIYYYYIIVRFPEKKDPRWPKAWDL